MHTYEIRPRKDHRGFDLISDVLPFGGLWYTTIPDAIDYAKHRRRAHDAVISVLRWARQSHRFSAPGWHNDAANGSQSAVLPKPSVTS